ncbi:MULTISPECIES: aspartate-semialdehyde dehydrogenase [Acidianus]|uniref:Aspartate-semialdehyde dehydrogenase n=1 Tax=Candidatus Acidianus copahuensis TaxID=1160895 RepID=A0A031LQ31_9CREN|nr:MULTISPECIES: aspartate-semialdehyde dehydrogenase [Acidianus]EZQ06830.1 aspartate-semialdehyde dehydrogenase [Candidatus Acidianus copahuensis]NON61493.1 aspartate-semialdehyde dehydrogenase [Acidianus sp. RZ1]
MDRLKVSLLGSTGMVGQKMVRMLSSHPFLELVKISASPSKVGKTYEESVRWVEGGEIPESVREMKMVSTNPEDHKDVDVILSALPNELAEEIELNLVRSGKIVVSNASPYRMDPEIPLINPEVNWEHLELVKKQQEKRSWRGLLIKNPNCTASILSMPMKPLLSLVSSKKMIITTLQAVSGAGYNGLSFMAAVNNIIPYIKGEEDKIPKELRKMLGSLKGEVIEQAKVDARVTSVRVPVKVGHMGIINVITEEVDIDEIKRKLQDFRSFPQERNLPTAPKRPIIVTKDESKPQPEFDLKGNEMATFVGRISYENDVLRLVVLGDNLVRGAAGITILTVEVMRELGYV